MLRLNIVCGDYPCNDALPALYDDVQELQEISSQQRLVQEAHLYSKRQFQNSSKEKLSNFGQSKSSSDLFLATFSKNPVSVSQRQLSSSYNSSVQPEPRWTRAKSEPSTSHISEPQHITNR